MSGPLEFVAGTVAGAAVSDAYHEATGKVKEASSDNSHGDLSPAERMMVHLLSRIEAAVRKDEAQGAPTVVQPLVLTNSATVDFNKRGYKHCWMLCGTSFKLNYYTTAGRIVYTTVVGWNNFDLPMKTQLQVDPTDVQSVQVVLYFSNDAMNLPGLAS